MKIIIRAFKYLGIVLITIFLTTLFLLLTRILFNWIGANELTAYVWGLSFTILGAGMTIAINSSDSGLLGKIISIILLIPLIVIFYFLDYAIDYHQWIKKISNKEHISSDKTLEVTNSFLKEKIGISGFLGYYFYTEKIPYTMTESQAKLHWEIMRKDSIGKYAYVVRKWSEPIICLACYIFMIWLGHIFVRDL